jgi:4-hydroxy-tetrahydrodipicolinate reductase
VNYAIIGYGRMGRAVDEQAAARGHQRSAIVDDPAPSAALDPAAVAGSEVAFEFTVADAAERNITVLLESGISVVCGTTGWQPSARLEQVARSAKAALVLAPNFSVGVNLFFRIVEQAARALGALGLHDPFVHEAHHRDKLDAPSGTAKRLASILVEADPRLDAVLEGHPSGRVPRGTLQVVSTRAGAEPGTHRVGFDGEHDLITLEHRARGRTGFALGAVLAGEWIVGRKGLLKFDDVLDGILHGDLRAEGETR